MTNDANTPELVTELRSTTLDVALDGEVELEPGSIERPPRDQLIRAGAGVAYLTLVEERAPAEKMPTGDGTAMPMMVDSSLGTLEGHFAVFDQWTEINSAFEGNFLERFAPGAFTKTFRDQRDQMRVTLNHGYDPQAGDKPLGPIAELSQDDTGAAYSVPLLDTSYNRDIVPGLRAGLYGASFRFRVMKEELVAEPEASDFNPGALPERTVKEAQVYEFGPVTFPAYPNATAGLRSLTDDFAFARIFGRISRDPERLARALELAGVDRKVEVDESNREPEPEPTTRRRATRNYLPRRRGKDSPTWAI